MLTFKIIKSASNASKSPSAKPDKASLLSATTTKCEVQEDEIDLMKGGTRERLERAVVLPGHGLNQIRNRLELALSLPPGDFSGTEAMLYLTKQYEVSWKYADYQKRITQPTVEIAILHVIIPQEVIAQAGTVELFGDEWKEYVMLCHLSQAIPQHLRHIAESPSYLGVFCGRAPNQPSNSWAMTWISLDWILYDSALGHRLLR